MSQPTPPVHYLPSPHASPAQVRLGGTRSLPDRPSPLAVVAVILFAIAIVMCAGLVGYVVRQLVDGDEGLSGLFSMITNDHSIEGSTTT